MNMVNSNGDRVRNMKFQFQFDIRYFYLTLVEINLIFFSGNFSRKRIRLLFFFGFA